MHRLPSVNPRREVHVISGNALAAPFIRRLLGERYSVVPVDLHAPKDVSPHIFIIDNAHLQTPAADVIRRLRSFTDSFFVVIHPGNKEKEISVLLSLGVHGVVPNHLVVTHLLQAVDAVASCGVWVTQRAFTDHAVSARRAVQPTGLTEREQQVLALLGRSLSDKEIGDLLRIHESAVTYHVSNLIGKMRVRNRLALAVDTLSPSFAPAF